MFGRVPLNEVITGELIEPGDKIIGVRSGGKIRYEKYNNSGIMSNGHTLARNCLMKPEYVEKYPEISHPERDRYTGRFYYDHFFDELDSTIGEALLSPTRLYSPIVKKVLDRNNGMVHGMVHNTGGGNTKCLRLGKKISYIKEPPQQDPIFTLIQKESHVKWREMYQDFNMGIGFEFIVNPDSAEDILSNIESFGVEAYIIGYCEESKVNNELLIKTDKGNFEYS
jgi:phosphoribosylformylglycinamidine cyclo-ligase